MNKEDNRKGNLTVTLNYLKIAQDIEHAIYFLNRIKDKLDIAAIEKGMKKQERRTNGERRGGLH